MPDWPAPASVRAACSTREGGVSSAPYDSLNLGDHVGDDDALVAENRKRFEAALAARPVYMKQVHGALCAQLGRDTPDGIEADACFTREKGVACTIMVADCLPVLLTDKQGSVVAATHAGWRGLASGVIEAAASRVPGAIAWLGPCIGPRKFEVGPEVREAFVDASADAAKYFRPHTQGKFLADLPGLARQRLQRLGITSVHGNDGTDAWCTVSNASRFFSHRRDRVSGRFAAAIWRG
ncbi:peptidoglycan editing factor PgeF [Ramlibacter sp. GTP1]|uniref:Purine nucleoside phosphorylase n=1 Tax=Ramlibacter albus TaxID=2079448 RepID=A0A923MFG9_9BURK|nr:peptidoglycan editing factor PgeF [Ramlibacter albus]